MKILLKNNLKLQVARLVRVVSVGAAKIVVGLGIIPILKFLN